MYKFITLVLILISWGLLAQEGYQDYPETGQGTEYREEEANIEPAPQENAPTEPYNEPYKEPYKDEYQERSDSYQPAEPPAYEENNEPQGNYQKPPVETQRPFDQGQGYNNEEREPYEENSYSEDY